jgi:hypothetical protein
MTRPGKNHIRNQRNSKDTEGNYNEAPKLPIVLSKDPLNGSFHNILDYDLNSPSLNNMGLPLLKHS